jgi:hypothetical protein
MPADSEGAFGLRSVGIRGFRSARDVRFTPGAVCALVGEASTGKSNVLAALWLLLEPGAPAPSVTDAFVGGGGGIDIRATLADGSVVAFEARPPGSPRRFGAAPDVAFLPAELRADALVATGGAAIVCVLRGVVVDDGLGSSEAAVGLVTALEACCRQRLTGSILLIDEPELYLRPQAQRYLYRLLRAFAELGNQVIYSTHSPAFLSVARLEELAFVERLDGGTTVVQREPLPPDENFQALAEFDAERSELFLARAALLVEGRTEKIVFPYVFRALGYDADREAISIVECGGKSSMVVVARVAAAAGVPFVVVYDRDAPAGRKPIVAERAVNAALAAVVPPEHRVELAPDFEAVAGLHARSHKPGHAWQRFVNAEAVDVPAPLVEAVERVISAAEEAGVPAARLQRVGRRP